MYFVQLRIAPQNPKTPAVDNTIKNALDLKKAKTETASKKESTKARGSKF